MPRLLWIEYPVLTKILSKGACHLADMEGKRGTLISKKVVDF